MLCGERLSRMRDVIRIGGELGGSRGATMMLVDEISVHVGINIVLPLCLPLD